MSTLPRDVERRFERRWASRFNLALSPKPTEPSRDNRTGSADVSRHQPPFQDKKAGRRPRRAPC
jgi:hypothetical protein